MNSRLADIERVPGELGDPRPNPAQRDMPRIAKFLTMAGIVILFVYFFGFYFFSFRAPIQVNPNTVDFGMVHTTGILAEHQATIQNRTKESIPVALAWSCDCLDVSPSNFELPPFGQQPLNIVVRNPPEPSVDQTREDWQRAVQVSVIGGRWQGWQESLEVRGTTLRAIQFSPLDAHLHFIEDQLREDCIQHEIPVGIVRGCRLISMQSDLKHPLFRCRFEPDESDAGSEPTSGRIVLEIPTELLSNKKSLDFNLTCEVHEVSRVEIATQKIRLTSTVQSAIFTLPSMIKVNHLDVPSIIELREQSNQVELLDFELTQSKHCRVRPLSNTTLEVIPGEIPPDEQGEVELRVRYRYGNADSSCVVRISILHHSS